MPMLCPRSGSLQKGLIDLIQGIHPVFFPLEPLFLILQSRLERVQDVPGGILQDRFHRGPRLHHTLTSWSPSQYDVTLVQTER